MPILLTKTEEGHRAYGSVVYEEFGSDDMMLEFFTARFDPLNKEKFENPEYPQ